MGSTIRRRRLHLVLALVSGLVITLGVFAELAVHLLPEAALYQNLLTLLSLSYEGNLPTWYSSTMLALCGGLLALCALGSPEDRWRWSLLCAGFFYISFDESVGVHEAVDAMFESSSGVFYFGWVMPATALVALLGLVYLPFLRRLPHASRRRFVIAGATYLCGALLLELPLGLWTEHAGPENLTYALIDLLEESLEIIGVSLFMAALIDHLGGPNKTYSLSFVDS